MTCAALGACRAPAVDAGSPNTVASAEADGSPPPASPVAASQAKGARALLVGINDYKYDDDIPDLRGTINDVEAMRDVLVRRYGFEPGNIVVLKDSQATKEGIERAFRSHLIEPANADTVAVFAMSSHGSEKYDTSGDEPSGYDQTLVTYDSGRSGKRENRDITDDEINVWLRELNQKTEHVTFIADSCHSGTLARASAMPRLAKPDCRGCSGSACQKCAPGGVPSRSIAEAAARAVQGSGSTGFRPGELSYVLISGAASNELSYERVVDGRPMGALTSFLTRALWKAAPGATYRDVMAQVAADVTSSLPAQHPQLEGRAVDTEFFGTRALPQEPFYSLRTEGSGLILEAGLIQGMSVGSQFSVYPAGTKQFDNAQPIAELELTEVGGISSRARLSKGTAPLPVGARAVETHHEFEQVSLRVRVKPARDVPIVKEIETALREKPQIALVAEEADYDMYVESRGEQLAIGRSTELERDDTTTVLLPQSGDLRQHAVNLLLRWARWNATRRLQSNEAMAADVTLTADVGTGTLAAGTPLTFVLHNKSPDQLFVSLFDLSSDGSITQVYPERGAHEFVPPGGSWSPTLLTCVPEGKRKVQDVVKVFLTREQHDLSSLEQPALSRGISKGGRSPLEDLLVAQGLGETRGVLKPTNVAIGTWLTREIGFEVEARPGARTCPSSSF